MGLLGDIESRILINAGIVSEKDYYTHANRQEVPATIEADNRTVAVNNLLVQAALKNTEVVAGKIFYLDIPAELNDVTAVDLRIASPALNYFDLDRPLPYDVEESRAAFQAVAPQFSYGPRTEEIREYSYNIAAD